MCCVKEWYLKEKKEMALSHFPIHQRAQPKASHGLPTDRDIRILKQSANQTLNENLDAGENEILQKSSKSGGAQAELGSSKQRAHNCQAGRNGRCRAVDGLLSSAITYGLDLRLEKKKNTNLGREQGSR
jgi:hypothetical protein